MAWQQLRCKVHLPEQQALTDYLDAQGALSVTAQDAGDQPMLEPKPGEAPLWDEIIVTALFDGDYNVAPVLLYLQHASPWQLQEIVLNELEDQVWERAWMQDFQPMVFGERLWIYPSWAAMPDDDSIKILLDPGLAFGSGTHPTTALCLEWLDQHPPENQSVIDFGCGSGILAIAAAKLGAATVIATDIDEQALIATQDNMQRNHVPDPQIIRCFPEQLDQHLSIASAEHDESQHDNDAQVDVILANILAAPLLELADYFAKHLVEGGRVVLSGILAEQQDSILKAYYPYFDQLTVTQKGDWVRVDGVLIKSGEI